MYFLKEDSELMVCNIKYMDVCVRQDYRGRDVTLGLLVFPNQIHKLVV